jgi:transcriptional regulator with XRE-family HTH domain
MKITNLNLSAEQTAAFVAAGNQLRTLREQKGVSQETLAADAGVDQSGLSKIERIGPQLASWGRLVRIAQALDCTIEINFRPK